MALSSRDTVSTTVYRAQCRVCHGEEAKGDGPAGAALIPRPPDLTRSERVRRMSDEELLQFLSVGKGSMPGFGKILTEQELKALVAWLQALNNVDR
jgi:high-affinity iron transporter